VTGNDGGSTTPDARLAAALAEVNRLRTDQQADEGRSLVRATIRGADAAATGRLLAGQEKLGEAERFLRIAMVDLAEAIEGQAVELAAVTHDLGTVLAARMKIDEASACYERSLAVRRAVLPADHPDVLATLHNWAVLCESAGRSEEAALLWNQANAHLASAHGVPDLDLTEPRELINSTVDNDAVPGYRPDIPGSHRMC
jgi:tetratricopeptide (TPR) repeat protein